MTDELDMPTKLRQAAYLLGEAALTIERLGTMLTSARRDAEAAHATAALVIKQHDDAERRLLSGAN